MLQHVQKLNAMLERQRDVRFDPSGLSVVFRGKTIDDSTSYDTLNYMTRKFSPKIPPPDLIQKLSGQIIDYIINDTYEDLQLYTKYSVIQKHVMD
jgi:hypothetical protein